MSPTSALIMQLKNGKCQSLKITIPQHNMLDLIFFYILSLQAESTKFHIRGEMAWISMNVPRKNNLKTETLERDTNIKECDTILYIYTLYIHISYISLGQQCFCLLHTTSVNNPALKLRLVRTHLEQFVPTWSSTLVKMSSLFPLPRVQFFLIN